MNMHIDEIACTIEMSKSVKRTSIMIVAMVMYKYVSWFAPFSVDGAYPGTSLVCFRAFAKLSKLNQIVGLSKMCTGSHPMHAPVLRFQ